MMESSKRVRHWISWGFGTKQWWKMRLLTKGKMEPCGDCMTPWVRWGWVSERKGRAFACLNNWSQGLLWGLLIQSTWPHVNAHLHSIIQPFSLAHVIQWHIDWSWRLSLIFSQTSSIVHYFHTISVFVLALHCIKKTSVNTLIPIFFLRENTTVPVFALITHQLAGYGVAVVQNFSKTTQIAY